MAGECQNLTDTELSLSCQGTGHTEQLWIIHIKPQQAGLQADGLLAGEGRGELYKTLSRLGRGPAHLQGSSPEKQLLILEYLLDYQ